MATKYHQISLSDIFSDCQNSFIDESPYFFSLLLEHFDLNEFIPPEFLTAFYLSIGRKRLYPLQGFLTAFILQKIFSIPTDSPDEDKSVGDASALVPVLSDYFSLHPDFHPDTFLGDSAFDSAELYGKLFHDFHFPGL